MCTHKEVYAVLYYSRVVACVGSEVESLALSICISRNSIRRCKIYG